MFIIRSAWIIVFCWRHKSFHVSIFFQPPVLKATNKQEKRYVNGEIVEFNSSLLRQGTSYIVSSSFMTRDRILIHCGFRNLRSLFRQIWTVFPEIICRLPFKYSRLYRSMFNTVIYLKTKYCSFIRWGIYSFDYYSFCKIQTWQYFDCTICLYLAVSAVSFARRGKKYSACHF